MIHDGVILEQGTFTELQEKDGEFKRLYAELGAVPEEDKDAEKKAGNVSKSEVLGSTGREIQVKAKFWGLPDGKCR